MNEKTMNILLIALAVLLAASMFLNVWLLGTPKASTSPPENVGLPGGSYLLSCQGCSVNANWLTCVCRTRVQSIRRTSVDLNSEDCVSRKDISNDDGNLVCETGP